MLARYALLASLASLVACSSAQRVRSAGAYRFQCEPVDAHVIVDEDDLGPCAIWSSRWLGLPAGPHRVRIYREGWLPQESDVTPNGTRVTVTARLRRVPD